MTLVKTTSLECVMVSNMTLFVKITSLEYVAVTNMMRVTTTSFECVAVRNFDTSGKNYLLRMCYSK